MNVALYPTTSVGTFSVRALIAFFAFLCIFFFLINRGERGGVTFFSNLTLTIPFLAASASGITAFIAGAYSMVSQKERAVFPILATLVGGFVTWWLSMEILFPH